MDPDANLKRQLELAAEIDKAANADRLSDESALLSDYAIELGELVESLNGCHRRLERLVH